MHDFGLKRWVLAGLLGLANGCEASPGDEGEVWVVDHYLESFCPSEAGWLAPRVQIEGEDDFHYAAFGLENFEFEWGVRATIRARDWGEPGQWRRFGVVEVIDREPVPEGTEFAISSGCQYGTGFDGSVVTVEGQPFVCESAAACEGLAGIADPWTWAGTCLRLRHGAPGDDIVVVGTQATCDRANGEITDFTSL
jgi:hypothetical protein